MTLTDGRPARIANSVTRAEAKKGKSGKSVRGSDGGDGAGDNKSKKKKIIIVVVLLLLVGAAAKFTVLAPAKTGAAAKPAPGPVIAMDELTLNLAGSHFLRLKLSLQTTKGTSEELEVTEGIQAVIDEYSNRTEASLTGDAARDKAKKELLTKLQKIYPKKILDVFYTEFVMQ
ncbi:flagellar basal body-associated FliL family protein [Jatrophihabitans sp. DSM 45814]